MPKLRERIGDGSYGFSVPKLCGHIGTVAMAFPRQSYADDSYGCAAPKFCGIEQTGQEAEANIGGTLALRI